MAVAGGWWLGTGTLPSAQNTQSHAGVARVDHQIKSEDFIIFGNNAI